MGSQQSGSASRCCCAPADDQNRLPVEVLDAKTADPTEEGDGGERGRRLPSLESTSLQSLPSSPKTALEKMRSRSHTEVDYEILRGIPLHRALQRPHFWTSPDEIRRTQKVSEVFGFSAKVERFDIFLSHTWRTKGRWKVLALLLQSGWLHALLSWFLGTALGLALRLWNVIVDPWPDVVIFSGGTSFSTSLSPVPTLIAGIFLICGVCCSPLLPFKTQMCYLDAACIHLGQGDLFERGIYSIAGCLSVASELRVLYSEQYLSSLWCLFELVGYRKAKPEGKLVFKPLFIERSVTMTALFMWCFALSINFVLSFTGESFRSEYIGVLYLLVFSLPLILIVHAMRRNYREKENLIFDLSNFELDRSTCASDFDRSFILSAIDNWYGDRDNFAKYVRGPLREELLQLLPSPHLPCSYVALILCGLITWCLDFCLSLQKAGASWEIITKQFFCMVAFFGLWNWAVFNGIFYLSDKTAHLGQSWLSECGKTFLVAGAIFCFAVLGFGAMITSVRSTKLVLACVFIGCSMLIPFCILDVFKVFRRRRMSQADLADQQ